MNKIFLLCAIAFLVTAGGCQTGTPNPQTPESNSAPLSSPAGMMDYLKDLPAVKSIELWENKYGQGLRISTDHYDIYTTLLDPLMLRQLPGFVESAYNGYQAQLPSPIKTQNRFIVYLFADRPQWDDFTKTFTAPNADVYLKIRSGAYYLNGACVAYNIGRTRTFAVLGHEGWHQFNNRHFAYRLPSWLDEGIAMSFETSRYENGRFYFEPFNNLGRLGPLRQALVQDRMMPLRELISLNPGEVIVDTNADAVATFYSQAYALVRFLREENYGKRLPAFQDMLLGAAKGTWPLDENEKKFASDRNIPMTTLWNRYVAAKLFRHYISEDFDAIEKEYIEFCKKIVYRVRVKK